jgi:arylsulfatase A-like enzyme
MKLTLLLALLAALCACGDPPAPARPNVVLITLDTTRADFLSCYGSELASTPHLDALAAEGTRFARAQSASAVTPVSHASILTGRYPYHHGLRVLSAPSGFRLPARQATLSTELKAAGYRTGAVHSAFPVSDYFGFARGYDHFDSFDAVMRADAERGKTTWDTRQLQRRSDETTDRSLAFARDGDEPFYLWIHYWDPHDQHLKPDPEYYRGLDLDKIAGTESAMYQYFYAAEIMFLDAQIGRLVAGLKASGRWDDTLVVVTADHGEGLADGFQRHGWSKHRMTYREQLHVPLIVRTPTRPGAAVVDAQVRTIDIAPTIYELCGLDVPVDVDGESLVPLLGGAPGTPRVAYADQVNGYDMNAGMVAQRPDSAFLYTVSDGEWKLIFRPHMPEASELFHVAVDWHEELDVRAAHEEQYLRLLADLAERNPWVVAPFEPDGSLHGENPLGELGYAPGATHAGSWWWTCPAHPDVRAEQRARCEQERCGRILVPQTTWPD